MESHVFSWSRSRELESVFKTVGVRSRSRFFKTAGVGVDFLKLLELESVFQNCWSRSRFFKTAGVGVGFSKLLESESVFQNCRSRNFCCNHQLQCLLNNLNYNINYLKIILGTGNIDYIQKALTAVCGKSDCLYTPFVTRTFHYILGNCYHNFT